MAGKKKAEDKRAPYELAVDQLEDRFQYLCKKDIRHGKVSYSDLDTGELLGEEMIPDFSMQPLEDNAICNIMLENLRQCLFRLSLPEQTLIRTIYYQGLTERQAAEQLGLPYMTVHDRKVRILQKLKRMLGE